MKDRIAVACDHGGFELKDHLVSKLEERGIPVLDLGVNGPDSVDYPEYGHAAAEAVLAGKAARGLVICGTGLGIGMAANRHPGIRAALCTNSFMARMAREHNDANILALGGRVIGPALAEDILDVFLRTPFAGDRHQRRIDKIEIS
jgi:ribose 5-phosphate isomerase B